MAQNAQPSNDLMSLEELHERVQREFKDAPSVIRTCISTDLARTGLPKGSGPSIRTQIRLRVLDQAIVEAREHPALYHAAVTGHHVSEAALFGPRVRKALMTWYDCNLTNPEDLRFWMLCEGLGLFREEADHRLRLRSMALPRPGQQGWQRYAAATTVQPALRTDFDANAVIDTEENYYRTPAEVSEWIRSVFGEMPGPMLHRIRDHILGSGGLPRESMALSNKIMESVREAAILEAHDRPEDYNRIQHEEDETLIGASEARRKRTEYVQTVRGVMWKWYTKPREGATVAFKVLCLDARLNECGFIWELGRVVLANARGDAILVSS